LQSHLSAGKQTILDKRELVLHYQNREVGVVLEGSHDYNHHYMSLFNSDGKSNDISSLPNATQMGAVMLLED